MIIGNYDDERYCPHTPDQTYTREPCSCGRELWPPRGRGRGESLTSPRRTKAKLRAFEAWRLRIAGYKWRYIARRLGYASKSGAAMAVQRLCDEQAKWARWEHETGRRRYKKMTRAEGERILAQIEADLQWDLQRIAEAYQYIMRQ